MVQLPHSHRGAKRGIPVRNAMAQALYSKYRSKDFDELVGQEHVTTTLRNAMREGRIAHAYLFTGPRGTGKTSMARIVAKALNCLAPLEQRPCNECRRCVAINEGRYVDLVEIDAASNNSVNDVRELREKAGFAPSDGDVKVYIVDEVHMLSTQAFNALLKTLEEPPPHVRFILATTEIQKVPPTILSRCQRFDFRRIPTPTIAAHLAQIVQEEGSDAEPEALTAIARSAEGCMRDAVSLLDQMLSFGEKVTFAQVQEALGAVSTQKVFAFVDALANRDAAAGLALIQELLVSGASLVEFCTQVIEHLRGVLMLQITQNLSLLGDLAPDTVTVMQKQTQQLAQGTTLFAIKRFGAAVPQLKGGFQPQLPLEMAFIECVQGVVNAPVAQQVASQVVQQPVVQQPVAQQPGAPVASSQQSATPPAKQSEAARPAPEKTVPEEAPPPVDERALTRLQGSGWKEFLRLVRAASGPQVQAYLNSVRDIAVGGNQVAFAFGANDFVRDQLSRPETQAQVAQILSDYLGTRVALECQSGDHARLSAVPQKHVATTDNSGPDPLVEFAVSELNAQVEKPVKR